MSTSVEYISGAYKDCRAIFPIMENLIDKEMDHKTVVHSVWGFLK